MEDKIVLVKFQTGYGLEYNVNGATVTSIMCLDEHGDTSILNGNHDMFKRYLDFLEKDFGQRIQHYYDTLEDAKELEGLKLKTVNTESLLAPYDENAMAMVGRTIFRQEIGNLAMVKVFLPDLYDRVIEFLEYFPREKEHVLYSGHVARNGVSTFDNYVKLINEIVVPRYKFLIKNVK